MKNISRFKLSIDRTKAPKKMGTFKDIYLFVNYVLTRRGSFYFTGWCWKGSKDDKGTAAKDFFTRYPNGWFNRLFHFLRVTTRREREVAQSSRSKWNLQYLFITHVPEPLQTLFFIQNGGNDSRMHPSSGSPLKKASRKREFFSLEQKEIMISF